MRGRLGMPKAELQNAIAIRDYDENRYWLHNEVTVLNRGETRIPMRHGFCRVRECLQSKELESQLLLGSDPKNVDPHHCAIDWDQLDKKTWRCMPGKEGGEIEPGEAELLHYDFLIPKSARLLHIESFLENSSKRSGIGWSRATVVDVSKLIAEEFEIGSSAQMGPRKSRGANRKKGEEQQ